MEAAKATHARPARDRVHRRRRDGDETEHELTPVQIMQLAGVDPESHYLKEIRGQQQVSYKDTPNEPIHVHNNQRFITNSLEPTPVS